MERILEDMSQQPPYVEVYSHAPLMCVKLVNTRQALARCCPKEHVALYHASHSTMDAITSSLGLYKIKALSSEGCSCLFAISPDMPPRQQADVMLHAAKLLRAALAKVSLPSGAQLASQITIHAGKYAGAVVGKTAWSYDLFGEDVQLLLDMDQHNSPDCIQVSQAALTLLDTQQDAFVPVAKISSGGLDVCLLRLQEEDAGSAGVDAAAAAAAAAARQQPQPWGLAPPASPQKQQQQQQQQQPLSPTLEGAMASARQAAAATQRQQGAGGSSACTTSTSSGSSGSSGSKGGGGGVMRRDLRFVDPALEAAYVRSQAPALARLDVLFVGLSLMVTLCSTWGPSGGPGPGSLLQQLVAGWSCWLLPAAAAVALLAAPAGWYARWREALWVGHRLLGAAHLAAALLGASLAARGAAAAIAGGGAVGGAAARWLLHLHRGRALTLLAEGLGLKVRFWLHAWTSTLCAALMTAALLHHSSSSSSSSSVGGGSMGSGVGVGMVPQPLLWELLQRLLLGWAGPTLLLYLWETEDRARFLEGAQQQQQQHHQQQQGRPGADVYDLAPFGSGPGGKCKEV